MHFKHKFKKNYGQNFLTGKPFAVELVNSLDIKDDEIVIEIGPGDGMITNVILDNHACELVAIDIDYDLLPNLIKRFSHNPKFHLVHEDILKSDIDQLLEKFELQGNVKVIGALPYNISKRVVQKFIDYRLNSGKRNITKMSFIVQEEVAKNYASKAPKASFLSNYVQLFADIKKLKSIPAHKFYPMPQVNGGIVVLTFHEVSTKNYSELLKFIKLGFTSPRKTLIKNITNSNKFKSEKIKEAFGALGLSLTARASELTVEQWKAFFDLVKQD